MSQTHTKVNNVGFQFGTSPVQSTSLCKWSQFFETMALATMPGDSLTRIQFCGSHWQVVRFSIQILPTCLVGGFVKVSIVKCLACTKLVGVVVALYPKALSAAWKVDRFSFSPMQWAPVSQPRTCANLSFGRGPSRSTFGANRAPTRAQCYTATALTLNF